MRQRKLKDLDGRMEAVRDWIVLAEDAPVGSWRTPWRGEDRRDAPLYLELGCGKGGFLRQIAVRDSDALFVGAEANYSVCVQAAEKVKEDGLANVFFLPGILNDPATVFGPAELDGVYLNFSDPWPKARHEKRRLTSRQFLTGYEKTVKPGGFLAFKTDNEPLFRFSVEEMDAMGYERLAYTEDLHHSEYAADNLITEYEAKFVAQGKPIHYIKIRFPE